MTSPHTALLLIGSPKRGASTSASRASFLGDELERHGVRAATLNLGRALATPDASEALHEAVAAADLVVLCFPLYVDTLPAVTTRALQLIAARRAAAAPAAEPAAFAAVCQCGFPEPEHNEVALQVCRHFAESAGFAWAGGLAMGAGGVIDGQAMGKARGMLRHQVRALELSAVELAAGRPVPHEAMRLMVKPVLPAVGYRFIANWNWHREHRKQGATAPLEARPFA
jgi:hypothetical protein